MAIFPGVEQEMLVIFYVRIIENNSSQSRCQLCEVFLGRKSWTLSEALVPGMGAEKSG
jgi:hypothetical protein